MVKRASGASEDGRVLVVRTRRRSDARRTLAKTHEAQVWSYAVCEEGDPHAREPGGSGYPRITPSPGSVDLAIHGKQRAAGYL
jgi:hypothetical protein